MKKVSRFKTALRKWHKLDWGVKIFLSLFFLFFLFEALIQLYPFAWVINNSLKTLANFNDDKAGITVTWEFANYIRVFSEMKIDGAIGYTTMLINSVWQTFLYLIVNLLASLLIAYALAKFRFPGKELLYGIMIFIQMIPIVGTGAAAYKLRMTFGMVNNPMLIWLGWAVGFDYSAFVMYGTFQGISNSYSESAEIDGANEFQILAKIIFPLIFPCVLALMVTNFVARWNDYTTSQIYLPNYPTLGYGIYLFNLGSQYSEYGKPIYLAALILSAIPGIIIYSALQNFIIKNVSVGGIKG